MMADDVACNPRNREPGSVFNHYDRQIDVYPSSVEIDYRGNEVTVESFLRVLTGRHSPYTSRSKRLNSNAQSNILIYLTGNLDYLSQL
jgi:phosphatidylinositol glycan class K